MTRSGQYWKRGQRLPGSDPHIYLDKLNLPLRTVTLKKCDAGEEDYELLQDQVPFNQGKICDCYSVAYMMSLKKAVSSARHQ